ncbi:Cuticle protein 14 isoform b [Halotydeus destructor]|nr:Cuticle protein 14 isoform b [Halotydeus destructor]
MKCAIVLAALATIASANLIPHAAIVNTGASAQFRTQDNVGNYAFGYNEDHSTGGTFRRETGDVHGNKVGSYGLRDIDGRVRIVNYVADAAGYRANIQSNEPGVEPKDPAAVVINKPGVVAAAPVIAAAPAYAAPVYAAAPVAHAAPLAHYAAAPVAHYGAAPIAHYGHAIAHNAYAAPIAYGNAYNSALGYRGYY